MWTDPEYVDGIVYVVDATDIGRLAEAKVELDVYLFFT
jgi:hypothetical protein